MEGGQTGASGITLGSGDSHGGDGNVAIAISRERESHASGLEWPRSSGSATTDTHPCSQRGPCRCTRQYTAGESSRQSASPKARSRQQPASMCVGSDQDAGACTVPTRYCTQARASTQTKEDARPPPPGHGSDRVRRPKHHIQVKCRERGGGFAVGGASPTQSAAEKLQAIMDVDARTALSFKGGVHLAGQWAPLERHP